MAGCRQEGECERRSGAVIADGDCLDERWRVIDQPVLFLPEELTAELVEVGEGPAPERILHPRNRLNEMTGEEWLYFTKSVLSTSYPSVYGHRLRKLHGANKPPQLMAHLIEFFTKSGGRVLDPFAGVGGTLIGSSIARPAPRTCVGIEISREWADVYARVLEEHGELRPQPMIVGDCLEVMDRLLTGSAIQATDGSDVVASAEQPFDFIAMDPPYNVHLAQTMSGSGGAGYVDRHANRRSDYNMRSQQAADLANLPDFAAFLGAMESVFARCVQLLRPARYMVVIVRNAYQGGEYLFTHAELAGAARRVGFIPKGEIVWYQAGTRLRPYGYPYSYIPNIAHQFILVLQRPPDAVPGKSVRRPRAGR